MQIIQSGASITVSIPINKGWMPDFPPHAMPEGGLITTGAVIPTLLGYKPARTFEQYSTGNTGANIPIAAKTFVHSNGDAYTLIGTTNKLYILRPDKTIIDVSNTATYNTITAWSFEQYGDWLLAASPENAIQKIMDFSSTQVKAADLGGSPGNCEFLFFEKGHLMMFNYIDGDRLTNGTFTGSATANWTMDHIVYSTNDVDMKAGSSTDSTAASMFQTDLTLSAANTYKVQCVLTDCTGSAAVWVNLIGDGMHYVGTAPQKMANGTFTFYPSAPDATASWSFVIGFNVTAGATATAMCTIDNVTMRGCYRRGAKWSAYENIESWSQSLSTGADSQEFYNLQGEIVGVARIPNGGFAIFSNTGDIINAYYIGGVFTYHFGQKLKDRGVYKNSFVETNKGVFFWSKRDICFYDGENITSIAQGIRETVFGTGETYGMDRSSTLKIFGWYDAERQLLYYSYPIATGYYTGSNLICYGIETGKWTYINYDIRPTCILPIYDDGNTYNIPELSYFKQSASSYFVYSQIDGSLDGNAVIAFGDLHFPDMNVYKIDRIRPRFGQIGSLTAIIGSFNMWTRMNEADAYTQIGLMDVSASVGTGWIDRMATSRYFKMQMTLNNKEITDILAKFTRAGDR